MADCKKCLWYEWFCDEERMVECHFEPREEGFPEVRKFVSNVRKMDKEVF